jgi:hypothetical protein
MLENNDEAGCSDAATVQTGLWGGKRLEAGVAFPEDQSLKVLKVLLLSSIGQKIRH